jgi:hypothetical protein
MNGCSRLDHNRMLCIDFEQTKSYIVEGCTKNSTLPFDVSGTKVRSTRGWIYRVLHSPATIFRMSMVKEPSYHFKTFLLLDGRASDIRPNNISRQQKVWAAIFSGPVTVWCLEVLIECISIPSGLIGIFGTGQSDSVLEGKL